MTTLETAADPTDVDDDDAVGLAPRTHRAAFVEMLVSSLLSLTASLVLSVEAVRLAADPTSTASCDINARISCSVVGLSWQAQLLGFPNAFLGLVFEPVVITLAVASLGGIRFPRWFMLGAQGLYTIAVAFALWLFQQAFFVIHALCPWCLLVTATTLLVFASMTRVNVLEGHLRVPRRLVWWVDIGLDHLAAAVLLSGLGAMVVFRYLV